MVGDSSHNVKLPLRTLMSISGCSIMLASLVAWCQHVSWYYEEGMCCLQPGGIKQVQNRGYSIRNASLSQVAQVMHPYERRNLASLTKGGGRDEMKGSCRCLLYREEKEKLI